jgi:hypothetical protein
MTAAAAKATYSKQLLKHQHTPAAQMHASTYASPATVAPASKLLPAHTACTGSSSSSASYLQQQQQQQ